MNKFHLEFKDSDNNTTVLAKYYKFEEGFITFFKEMGDGHFGRVMSYSTKNLNKVIGGQSGNNN